MKLCNQTETQTVYEHGLSVWKYTQRILNKEWDKLSLPQWFTDNFNIIENNIFSSDIIREYNIYHDCGKPYCIEIDADGKSHFRNHAKVSSEVWSHVTYNPIVTELISLDMILHMETANQIQDRKLPFNILFTLLVTAFAELHSNANMFGEIDSLSFKIKYKKICKRGEMLVRLYNEQ